jgi:ligand-binding SRPBCC domain-containing protein
MTSTPRIFRHRSVLRATVADLARFHSATDALRVLTPPPIILEVVRDNRTALTRGEITFRLWFGPLPVRWVARHEPGSYPTVFADRMRGGPLASWRHEHAFRAVEGGVELLDVVTYAHRPGWRGALTRLAFGGPALRAVFWYRHWRTRRAVERAPTRSRPAER